MVDDAGVPVGVHVEFVDVLHAAELGRVLLLPALGQRLNTGRLLIDLAHLGVTTSYLIVLNRLIRLLLHVLHILHRLSTDPYSRLALQL